MSSFTGGDKLRAKMAELVAKLGPGKHARVGFLEGSTCGVNNDASAPEVAFYNEYGTIGRQTLGSFKATGTITKAGKIIDNQSRPMHIPPRPFFRDMIRKRSGSWSKLLSAALVKAHMDPDKALGIVGLVISEQLQISIKQFKTPRNADSTIAAKGFDKPLENSDNMLRAVSYDIKSGGGK